MATATTTRQKAATTGRSTAGKKAAATRRRNAARRSAAAKQAAATRALATRTPLEQAQEIAERAILIPVGAALTARDRVVETVGEIVDTYGSRASAQRKLETNLRRYERRGTTARNQLQRDVKKTRTRVERELRQRRNRAERVVTKQVKQARKDASARVDLVSSQVENLVATSVNAGSKLVARGVEGVPTPVA
jgi:F0F1-type ATP synthase membrane subunit b/b'